MRLTTPPTLLTLLSTLLTCTHALPATTEDSSPDSNLKSLLESRYHYLSGRSCTNPCGWSGQVCCSSSQTCSTNSAGQAVCSGSSPQEEAGTSNGQWEYYTTTIYVESDVATYTSTYSSYFGSGSGASAAPVAAISSISCNSGLGESPCGTLCCATGQYCLYAGQCAASSNNLLESVSSSIQPAAAAPTTTPAASEPLRPTVNAATTVTSTGIATATVPFMTPSAGPASASSSALPGMTETTANNGLSAGAIAGIVIGVLAALFFLFIICAILCCKGLIDGILDFFGLRKRRRTKETYIEEEHRHGGRTWYGARRPVRDETVVVNKKKGRWGSVAGFAGALGVLAVVLGLKRRERRKSEKARSRYSESSYGYYDDTSESE